MIFRDGHVQTQMAWALGLFLVRDQFRAGPLGGVLVALDNRGYSGMNLHAGLLSYLPPQP